MSKLDSHQKQMIRIFLEENFADFCDHLEDCGATAGPHNDAEGFGEAIVEILNEEADQ